MRHSSCPCRISSRRTRQSASSRHCPCRRRPCHSSSSRRSASQVSTARECQQRWDWTRLCRRWRVATAQSPPQRSACRFPAGFPPPQALGPLHLLREAARQRGQPRRSRATKRRLPCWQLQSSPQGGSSLRRRRRRRRLLLLLLAFPHPAHPFTRRSWAGRQSQRRHWRCSLSNTGATISHACSGLPSCTRRCAERPAKLLPASVCVCAWYPSVAMRAPLDPNPPLPCCCCSLSTRSVSWAALAKLNPWGYST